MGKNAEKSDQETAIILAKNFATVGLVHLAMWSFPMCLVSAEKKLLTDLAAIKAKGPAAKFVGRNWAAGIISAIKSATKELVLLAQSKTKSNVTVGKKQLSNLVEKISLAVRFATCNLIAKFTGA